ncbi:MAG: SpoIIE family protein phosphatase [Clostridia bacterium]|nr:SpoIIE family protein phosphatase [Clostridia bacterium]
MAEAIIRQHRRRTDRWMPKEKRHLPMINWRAAAAYAVRCVPGLLLSFAEMVGIPSGLHCALGTACAALALDIRPILAGGAAAFVLRLICGLPMRWELLLTLALLACCRKLLRGKGSFAVGASAAVALLPTAIAGCFAPTAAEMIKAWAAMAIAGLSAPVFARAIRSLQGAKSISTAEEQVSVGYLAAMCLCGGARMMLLGVNVGCWLSGCLTAAMSLVLGTGAGAMTGMLAGVVLALQGLPLTTAVALSMGGFLAGVAATLSRRRLSCGAFAMGAYLPLLLCGGTGLGCGAAVLVAALTMGLLPRVQMERIKQFLRRFLDNTPVPGDAYASAALIAWEKTVAAMARAVPSPVEEAQERTGDWWQERLCQGCPEYERCGCMRTGLAVTKAEAAWAYRNAQEEIWQDALEYLRGLGCQRLYHLMESMHALRREDEQQRRIIRQAEAQRNMLVTHLLAMSGAARRFSALSAGDSWWDHLAAKRIRKELAERAIPVSLSYVRRVQGHAQAAFELQFITGARKQAEELCLLASAVLDLPMQLAEIDGERLLLAECPPLTAAAGVATVPVTNGVQCGDTVWQGDLQDGRYLVALSDGMGHGEAAQLASRQAVELLRLCLDAGYSRQQALTAVNGMMLLGSRGERFATADVLTIDLWKGHAALDKMGAAASWVQQAGVLTRCTSDTLPLGILEDIDLSGSDMRLHEGDAVVLLTDGVEEAFRSTAALENTIRAALEEENPQDAAEAILSAAYDADGGQRRDDQSAVVVFIRKHDFAKENEHVPQARKRLEG